MKKSKILVVHNYYLRPSGEDTMFSAEARLLRSSGHEVIEYVEDNRRIGDMSRGHVALDTIWSRKSYQNIRELLERERPQVAHFHNTFPLLSPSAYYACREMRVTVVQTLHNYRLICPVAYLFRDGHVCEECVGKLLPWPGVRYGCYHHSRTTTAVVAGMLSLHRMLGTWQDKVDAYIAVSDFGRRKFIEGGLPAEKIEVKSNFIDPDPGEGLNRDRFALFVGRLSPEKGIGVLLRAWEDLEAIPLKIAGVGPLDRLVERFAETHPRVEYLGQQEREQILKLMKSARFLIVPSEWYEGFPMVIAEAFACGLPVISSSLGSLTELVTPGATGLLFSPSNSNELLQKALWAWEHPQELAQIGRNARRRYEERYTAEKNYEQLAGIYERAVARARNTSAKTNAKR